MCILQKMLHGPSNVKQLIFNNKCTRIKNTLPHVVHEASDMFLLQITQREFYIKHTKKHSWIIRQINIFGPYNCRDEFVFEVRADIYILRTKSALIRFMLVSCKTPWWWSEGRNMSQSWWNVCETVLLIPVHLLVLGTNNFKNRILRFLTECINAALSCTLLPFVKPIFYHCTRHLYITWTKWSYSTSSHPLASMTILILSSHLRPCLPRGQFASGCPTKTAFLTSHTLICPVTPSSYTVPCTRCTHTRNVRYSTDKRRVCPVFIKESMLKYPFLSQDPRSEFTSPYHLLTVVLRTFYWRPSNNKLF